MFNEKLCVVIIGGTGFVGRRIVEQLMHEHEDRLEIRALVRDPNKLKDDPRLTKIIGSLPDVPKNLFPSKPHIVIHFGTKNKDHDCSGYEHINVIGTRNIMTQLPESTIAVIYGSSFSAYGQGNLCKVSETTPVNPETPLAKSRVKAEEIVLEEMRCRGRSAMVLRPRFIIGGDDQHTLPLLVKAYNSHINIGTGKQVSSYIDVGDYARVVTQLVHYILINSKESNYTQTAVNIGYKRTLTLKELHKVFAEALGSKWQLYIPVAGGLPTLLKATNLKALDRVATLLELGAFSHSADVTLLEQFVGSEIVQLDPRKIIYEWLKQPV